MTVVPKAPMSILRGPLRDMSNRMTQGEDAPKAQERIWVDPTKVDRIYTRNPSVTPDFKRRHSGMVIDGSWDTYVEPIDTSWKIAACIAHFRDGTAWPQTGVYERMQAMVADHGAFDSCTTMHDIEQRYAEIDALFASIHALGFRDDTVTKLGTPRLPEGVFIHIDRTGAPIFGAIGNHRMGIARALGLRCIPAQLGVVHPDGASHLSRYRHAT